MITLSKIVIGFRQQFNEPKGALISTHRLKTKQQKLECEQLSQLSQQKTKASTEMSFIRIRGYHCHAMMSLLSFRIVDFLEFWRVLFRAVHSTCSSYMYM